MRKGNGTYRPVLPPAFFLRAVNCSEMARAVGWKSSSPVIRQWGWSHVFGDCHGRTELLAPSLG